MPLTTSRSATGWILPLLIAACHAAGPESIGVAPEGAERERLPTGRLLDPAVPSMLLSGSFPLSAVLSPDSGRVAVLLSGYSRQGIEIVDLRRRRVTQTLEQPAAFVGLAFSPDGRTLYASGGNQDVVYRYAWDSGRRDAARLAGRSANQPRGEPGTRYPAGLGDLARRHAAST